MVRILHVESFVVCKMAQDVGMVGKCCGVVPILFACFILRDPSLHVLVFIEKTFVACSC